MTTANPDTLATKYDIAANRWADKMRLLGYYDAYLGLLSSQNFRAPSGTRVLDIGCGTAAFAEAWIAIHGPDQQVTLLDPSAEMLTHGARALAKRGVVAQTRAQTLQDHAPDQSYHCLMAAHVLEHAADPVQMLRQMRALVAPDARLWLSVSKPHWCNAIIWLQWRHRAYRADQVENMLDQAGWQLETDYAFPSGPPSRTSRGYLAKAV
ncbi:bifunctional 2-polyprenyl-6-hydroxyphenol methylase/3-demethylubiquinol 3-O-methyltransferase UbiG [uncultured Litoreibacter sp.]|uniref:class I SAM-dependent methyltransferase n=1 Tax=uncultured Litoreibacter sp. TaxID=1392394 RepID=UPI0026091998|nr:class I SAM-dependent methyltransferase [uncultured Litoreibacter sp.]